MTTTKHPANLTNDEFLDELRDMAMNRWIRDETIGEFVRMRWAQDQS